MNDAKLFRIGMEALKAIEDPDLELYIDELTRLIFLNEKGYWSHQYTTELERVPRNEWFEHEYSLTRQEAEDRILDRFLKLAAFERRLEIKVKGVVLDAT